MCVCYTSLCTVSATNALVYIVFILEFKPRLHDTTCCQTGLTTGCIVYTNIQLVVKTGLTTGLTTGCIVYTAVVKLVVQPGLTTVLNEQLFVQQGCQTGCSAAVSGESK